MNLPYRYRGVALLALLLLLLPWLCWRFSFRGTVGTWRECRRLERRLEAAHAQQAGVSADRTAAGPELILSGGLLDTLARIATEHSVRIAGYEPVVTLREEGVAVHAAQLTLAGSYADLLRVADALDRRLPGCRLSATEWQATTDRRTRHTELTLILYMQQIVLSPLGARREEPVSAAKEYRKCDGRIRRPVASHPKRIMT